MEIGLPAEEVMFKQRYRWSETIENALKANPAARVERATEFGFVAATTMRGAKSIRIGTAIETDTATPLRMRPRNP
jgi:hypothetical protein